jgi:hypothetical protein
MRFIGDIKKTEYEKPEEIDVEIYRAIFLIIKSISKSLI